MLLSWNSHDMKRRLSAFLNGLLGDFVAPSSGEDILGLLSIVCVGEKGKKKDDIENTKKGRVSSTKRSKEGKPGKAARVSGRAAVALATFPRGG